MKQSISSIAESIILQDIDDISEGKKPAPNGQSITSDDPSMPDISEVTVPDDFISRITGKSQKKKVIEEDTIEYEEEVVEENFADSTLLTEETGQELVSLLSEAIRLLEMTTAGSLGVNLGCDTQQVNSKSKGIPKKKKKDTDLRDRLRANLKRKR